MTVLQPYDSGGNSTEIEGAKVDVVRDSTKPSTNPFGQPLDSINETFLSEHEELLISWDDVAIKSELACGAYGTVSSGLIERDELIVSVAVKELTWHSLSAAKVSDFEREIEIVLSLEHPNIVVTFGACISPLALIMEHLPLGDLRTFLQLRDEEGPVTTLEQKQYYAFQLASGMNYIAKHGIVHRDVAARNCLVGYPSVSSFGMHVLKICDFGLARELPLQLGADGEPLPYIQGRSDEKIPFRWLAPEALKFNEFSTKSDVYAYGVTVWEIAIDCSAEPYQDMDLSSVRTHVSTGGTLPLDYIHPTLATVIKGCTQASIDRRPTFLEMAELCAIELSENHSFNDIIARKYTESGDIILVRPKPDLSIRPLPPAPLPSIGSADEIIYETTDSTDDVGPLRMSSRYIGMRGGFYEDSHMYSSSIISGKGPVDRHVSFNSVNCDSDKDSGVRGLHNLNIPIRPSRGGCAGVWGNPNSRKRLLSAGLLALVLLLIAIVPVLIYFVVIPASKEAAVGQNTGATPPITTSSPQLPNRGLADFPTIPHSRNNFVIKLFDTTINTTSNSCFDGSQFTSCDKAMKFGWVGEHRIAAVGDRGQCLANLRGDSTNCTENSQNEIFCGGKDFLGIDLVNFHQASNCTQAPEWEVALIHTVANQPTARRSSTGITKLLARREPLVRTDRRVNVGRNEWEESRPQRQRRRQRESTQIPLETLSTDTSSKSSTSTDETTTEDEATTSEFEPEPTQSPTRAPSGAPTPTPSPEQAPSHTPSPTIEKVTATTDNAPLPTVSSDDVIATSTSVETGSEAAQATSGIQVVTLRDRNTKELVKNRQYFVGGVEVQYLLLRRRAERNVAYLVLEEDNDEQSQARPS